MKKIPMKKHLLDLDLPALEREMAALKQSPYRARQIATWLYGKKADAISAFTDLPKEFRAVLDEKYAVRTLELAGTDVSRRDGTMRFNFLTADRYRIPAVFLPTEDRATVCISTQAGCPVGCAFCASGKIPFKRNLTRGEILEQIIRIEQETRQRVSGVLFMGMGEPLLNFDSVLSALRAIIGFKELGIGRRHVTVSTVGIVPLIRKLADEKLGIRLALSLHAPDDAIRRKFIPESVYFSVSDILKAGLYFSRTNNSTLTIEYILVHGVNDTTASALALAELIKSVSKAGDEITVNLIPCNDTGADIRRPSDQAIERFRNQLVRQKILAIVREAKGADIGAACGQLGVH